MSDLTSIKGIGVKVEEKLNLLGINSLTDLVNYLPTSYINMNDYGNPSSTDSGCFIILRLKILGITPIKRPNKALDFFRVTGLAGDDTVTITWFNQPYLRAKFNLQDEIKVFGKIYKNNEVYEMTNPVFEFVNSVKSLDGIVPIYRTKGVFSQKVLRSFINEALKNYHSPSVLYDDISKVLKLVHNPCDMGQTDENFEKIVLNELVTKILAIRTLRRCRKVINGNNIDFDTFLDEFSHHLDFTLTKTQINAIKDILSDVNSQYVMNRLLSGDVGSGKTVVAAAIADYVAKGGKQVALLAPTEILARQHFKTFKEILPHRNIVFLTSDMKLADKKSGLELASSGKADIIIGTATIVGEKVDFARLGLAIIDESHRFGVALRARLLNKGDDVDTLIMTATPIPRSLNMMLYGELTDSYIERRNDMSKMIETIITNSLEPVYERIERELELGNNGFVVAPRIEDGEGIEIDSTEKIFSSLTKRFKGRTIALLNGKMKEADKARIMSDFYDGTIDILVSTTVIEVGIDSVNATFMAILSAERFGLATLHQLRGRVGRHGKKSVCFLCTKSTSNSRLIAFSDNYNGMDIAELDYTTRGAGEYIGYRQSGKVVKKYGSKIALSVDLVKKARAEADAIDFESERVKTIVSEYVASVENITFN